MNYEKPSRFVGPLSYRTAAKALIEQNDNTLLSFEEILEGLTRFLLTSYSNPGLLQAKIETRRALRENGIWGYTNVYWKNDSFFIKNDIFGLGRDLDLSVENSPFKSVVMPSNPQRISRYDPNIFGMFDPKEFDSSPAGMFFGRNSQRLVKLAERNGSKIVVNGKRVKKDELARTVCSISFDKGNLNLNLADDEENLRYAIGRKTKCYDPSRFTQP